MTKKPNAIDKLIGRKIKQARLESRMTQQSLAAALGKTFQQIQKYEAAKDRTAPGILWYIAKATGKPIEWFYDAKSEDLDPDRKAVRFMKAWRNVEGTKHEAAFMALLESFARE